MFQSQFFTKTSKEAPKDEASLNAKLLEQAGFVQKVLAGVYTLMPLGNRVLQKIENIVRSEMNLVGAEILMPSLQPKENWEKTGRWSAVDVLFKLPSQHGSEYALGPTHEEIVAPAAKQIIMSYRDLPTAAFQIQTKFRDEARAKSGLMRGREFRMKDLYSFHASQEDLDQYYSIVQKTYQRTFTRLGLNAILTEASGGSFSKYSHEYQVELPTGEDVIYICEKCGLAKNKEVFEGAESECTNCGKTAWRETKACEVGNIFKLGTKFSAPFEVKFTDEQGNEKETVMGCYGIGTTRLMGVIAELFNDEKGLVWPVSIAPFTVHMILLLGKDEEANRKIAQAAMSLYEKFWRAGIDVLVDDRRESAGVKFNDADLIGIPHRLVLSDKTVSAENVEWKKRSEQEAKIVSQIEIVEKIVTDVKNEVSRV